MRFGTLRYSVKQGFRNIARNRMFSIASMATMAACIFLFGIFFSIITNFNYIVEKAEEGVAIVVYFDAEASDERVKEIGDEIRKLESVAEVKYVSADQALEDFLADYLEGNEELAAGFTEDNPLVDSDNYEVYLKSVEQQAEVVEFVEGLEGVRKVNKSDVVAKTLSNFNVLLAYVSGAIILILLIVAVFLISNTVSMGITIRREEIAIMKYIGAKDSFVRAPFIIEGIMIGVIGASIPLVILYFAYGKASNAIMSKFAVLNSILDFLPASEVYKTLLPVGLALGVGIGFLGSFFTIRKHLRA
ncbi:MAG: permease-like cell division protein FtsX [Faecalimonas sp.]|nr:permease-like cell division protein FtsX [Faecalimonas sp.]